MKYNKLVDLQEILVHGRITDNRNPLTIFWSGGGIEVRFRGSELWLDVAVNYSVYEPWIVVLLNGEQISRQMLVRGRYKLCVLRGLDSEQVNTIKIIKDVQAMSGDNEHCLQFFGLEHDGHFLPIAEKDLKIEFIGDSITCGEGTIGERLESSWLPAFMSIQNSYVSRVSHLLKADYRVFGQSGWGICSGWDNNPYCCLPIHYNKVCSIISGEKNEILGATEFNDFSTWIPNYIVVNLGTNDESAFSQPAYIDVKTGESFKQRMDVDGTINQEDLQKLTERITWFLKELRGKNPNAKIIWAYGAMNTRLTPIIFETIDAYKEDTNDKSVFFLELPLTVVEDIGSREHPGKKAHEKMATVIASFIKGLIE